MGTQSGQVLSIISQMTDRNACAATRLRASEDRYALATAAGSVGVWDWNITNDQTLRGSGGAAHPQVYGR